MFTVVYRFEVRANREMEFIEHWAALTKLIKQFEGGLGSRLHKSDQTIYHAYAQWPDKNTWEKSGDNMPPEATAIRESMRECIISSSTVLEMDVVKDLLVHPTNGNKK